MVRAGFMPVATDGHDVSPSNGGLQPNYNAQYMRIVLPVILLLLLLFLILIVTKICFLARHVLHQHRLHLAATSILIRGGVKPSALAALPTFAYSEEVADECSVCLRFMEKGELVRLLPGCNHVFHMDCIDMWLHSHSTCPLCRTDANQTPHTEPVNASGG